jgi:hypothetical protein
LFEWLMIDKDAIWNEYSNSCHNAIIRILLSYDADWDKISFWNIIDNII